MAACPRVRRTNSNILGRFVLSLAGKVVAARTKNSKLRILVYMPDRLDTNKKIDFDKNY